MKCYKGNGCPFRGDLPQMCMKYLKGNYNGDPIFAFDKFPDLCIDCESRDVDFCYALGDLICFKQKDPFDCNIQLSQEELHGLEHGHFVSNSINEARHKRKWQRGMEKPKRQVF